MMTLVMQSNLIGYLKSVEYSTLQLLYRLLCNIHGSFLYTKRSKSIANFFNFVGLSDSSVMGSLNKQ